MQIQGQRVKKKLPVYVTGNKSGGEDEQPYSEGKLSALMLGW